MKVKDDNTENQFLKKRKMPVWKLIIIDTAALAVSMGVFMLFDYVLPQSSKAEGQIISDISEKDNTAFEIPSDDTDESEASQKDRHGPQTGGSEDRGAPKGNKDKGKNTGNTNTTSIASDSDNFSKTAAAEVTENLLEDYSDDNVKIKISEKSTGSGSDKITYYTADIYVSNIKYFQTAFADNQYGKNLKDTIDNMAEENNAVLAVNGDFYGNGEDGIVIRNGVLYRSNINDADICVLFTDGTMKTYSPDEFNSNDVIAQGAWQAWTFGPALLDGSGKTLSSFNTTSYLNSDNPRTAIGYVLPGHYVLVVVDGRSEGHSKGATLSELAQIMIREGALSAYNLDGGKSSGMVFKGSYINEPVSGGREVSDIVYIASS